MGLYTLGNTVAQTVAQLVDRALSVSTITATSTSGANSFSAATAIYHELHVRTVGTLSFKLDPTLNLLTASSIPSATIMTGYLRSTASNEALLIGGGRNSAGSLVNHIQNSTSGYVPFGVVESSITPASGSGTFSAIEIRPTINGVSSGTASALAIATLTNTLTGGSVNLIDAGTTTSTYGSGFTSKFKVDTSGNVTFADKLTFSSYTDDSANAGNRTVNTSRGKSALAAASATITITNSKVTTASQVICTLEFADATATQILNCIPASGSFTVNFNAAATADTKFSWVVIN